MVSRITTREGEGEGEGEGRGRGVSRKAVDMTEGQH